MDAIKDVIRQYWLNILAFGVFVAALIRYVRLAGWEEHLVPFACAAFGFDTATPAAVVPGLALPRPVEPTSGRTGVVSPARGHRVFPPKRVSR